MEPIRRRRCVRPIRQIDRLCDRLAVTKGSFYWHFTDIAGYRATLIDACHARVGLHPSGALETTGRTSGQPGRTPLGGSRVDLTD